MNSEHVTEHPAVLSLFEALQSVPDHHFGRPLRHTRVLSRDRPKGGALPRRPERQSADAPSGGAALLPGAAPTRTTPRHVTDPSWLSPRDPPTPRRAHAPPLPLTQHRRRSTNVQLPTTSGHTTNHNTAMHDNEMTLPYWSKADMSLGVRRTLMRLSRDETQELLSG
jgi:hypothetical protein